MTTNEPILVNGAAISGAVVAIIAVLVAFGVPITEGQNAAITGVVSAVVVPLATWWLARRKTVPVARANQALKDQATLPNEPVELFKVGS